MWSRIARSSVKDGAIKKQLRLISNRKLSNATGLTTTTLGNNLEMTTLKNRLRVVSDSSPGHFSALGAFVDAGSRYEDPQRPGLSHVMSRLAFKSTEKFSGEAMMDRLATLGGNYRPEALRESMIYQAGVFNKDVEQMLECIAQTIRYPKLTDEEVEWVLQSTAYEAESLQYNTDSLLLEKLHEVAYQDNTVGIPLSCPLERVNEIQKDEIVNFHNKFYQPQNIIIAMVGVPHEIALKYTLDNFGDWEVDPSKQFKPEVGKVNYTGGEIFIPHQKPLYSNQPELYHMQIAFETSGIHDDLYPVSVLAKLLGGGASFSSGGPGKGMFSRLNTQVLNRHHFVNSCISISHPYMGTGLLGVSISLVPQAAHVSSQIIAHELAKLLESDPAKGGLKENELSRAKNQLCSNLLTTKESKVATLDDLGRQVQYQGKVTSIDEMVDRVNAVSLTDLRNIAEQIFTGNVVTKGASSGIPSVVMQGDREAFGDVEFVLRHYGLGKYPGPPILEPRSFAVKESKGWFS